MKPSILLILLCSLLNPLCGRDLTLTDERILLNVRVLSRNTRSAMIHHQGGLDQIALELIDPSDLALIESIPLDAESSALANQMKVRPVARNQPYPTELFETPNGKLIGHMDDQVKMRSVRRDGDWTLVSLEVWVKSGMHHPIQIEAPTDTPKLPLQRSLKDFDVDGLRFKVNGGSRKALSLEWSGNFYHPSPTAAKLIEYEAMLIDENGILLASHGSELTRMKSGAPMSGSFWLSREVYDMVQCIVFDFGEKCGMTEPVRVEVEPEY
jgi:hypothetical protein